MDKFFRTEIRGEEEGFSSKAEFYRADDQSLNGNGGGKKVFSIEATTASMQQTSILNRITHTR